MAIQKTVTTVSGLDAVDAYHRVDAIRFDAKQMISFNLNSYKAADEAAAFQITGYQCQYDLDGANPYTQAYNHLKTLEQFADATDC